MCFNQAYGVHKTLFLPIRLTLTASLLPKVCSLPPLPILSPLCSPPGVIVPRRTAFAETRTHLHSPQFVAWMTRLGWAGKGAKGVQAKVKQVVEKTKEAAKRS